MCIHCSHADIVRVLYCLHGLSNNHDKYSSFHCFRIDRTNIIILFEIRAGNVRTLSCIVYHVHPPRMRNKSTAIASS